ncbi:MAG: alpha/beta hydrolase [Candidatus Helarchaeota archaeon]|nr:alpha/beta hydrolase [Candidatus Helarchaeota archaeon]
MVSQGMKNIIEQLRAFQAQASAEPSVEAIREGLETLAAMSRIPKGVKRKKLEIEGMKALWLTLPDIAKKNAILYLHGGGYVAGGIGTHRELVGRIALASKAHALLIDYRLAPEHPFPAALEDAMTAYRWLVSKEGISPKNIVIAGDSAGGGLTLATLIKLRDEGDPLPVAAVFLSPWTDLANTGETVKTKAEIDPFVSPEGLEMMAEIYLGDADARNPLASPLYGNLQGLPPLLIQVGSAECLLDDAVRCAERAKSAGVDVTLEVWDDMIHVFQAFANMAPEGQKGIEKIGEFIQKFLK